MSSILRREVRDATGKGSDAPSEAGNALSVSEQSAYLTGAIYSLSKSYPFMGHMIQCLNIAYSSKVGTAAIILSEDKRWRMFINPHYFCNILTSEQRVAILLHEIYHVLHNHPFRVPYLKVSNRKLRLLNIAADMAINQLIKNLPNGCPDCPPLESNEQCQNKRCPGRCIDVNNFFDEDPATGIRTPWPKNKTMEYYYELLIRRFDDPRNNNQDNSKAGSAKNASLSNGLGSGGLDEGNAGGGAHSHDLPSTLDDHLWDGSLSEKDVMDATEDLIKRAMLKSNTTYSELPENVRSLLEYIEVNKAKLNYKALILSAIKKHASGHDRKHTWTRVSRRLGTKAPGTKIGDLPKLELYIDTSGSISTEELNEFLSVVDSFLKVGNRKCNMSFFNVTVYNRVRYKLGSKINKDDICIGGTSLQDVLKDILKRKGDLNIIITDGCFDDVSYEAWLKPEQRFPQVLWVISKEGEESHPLKRLGKTVKIPKT